MADSVSNEEIAALQILLGQDAPPPSFEELRRTWPKFKEAFGESTPETTEE